MTQVILDLARLLRSCRSDKPTVITYWLVALFVLSMAMGNVSASPTSSGKPLLIVSNVQFETLFRDLTIRYPYYHLVRSQLTASYLAEFNTILITPKSKISMSDPSLLKAFFDRGGQLILVGPRNTNDMANLAPSLGNEVRFISSQAHAHVQQPDHPLLKGVDIATLEEVQLGTVLSPAQGGESVIGVASQAGKPAAGTQASALWTKKIGNGRLIFVSDSFFPPYGVPNKIKPVPAWPAQVDQLLKNLLAEVQVPTLEQAVKAMPDFTLWYREPTTWQSARISYPLEPQNKQEQLEKVVIHAGGNEHQRSQFFTTLSKIPATIGAKVSDLQSTNATIAAKHIKVGYQGRPTPDYSGPMTFVRWLNPDDHFPNDSPVITWWLDVDTSNARAGVYKGHVALNLGSQTHNVPVELVVEAAALPSRRLMQFDIEYYIYHSDVFRTQWLEHFQEMGVTSFIGGAPQGQHLTKVLTLRDTGESLADYAAKASQPIGANLPPLDYSYLLAGQSDFAKILQQAVAHGLVDYRSYYFGGVTRQTILRTAKILYRDDSITEDSPQVDELAIAYMSQYARFLRERGYRNYYTKTMDEWGTSRVDKYLKVAIPASKAGWANLANPNIISPLSDRIQRGKIWPYIHAYWIEGSPSLWYELQRRYQVPAIDMPTGYHTILTSSYWWDLPILGGPRALWATAWRGYAGFHLHGWTRNSYTAQNVLLLDDKRTVCPSQNLLMVSQSYEDAQYLALLNQMTDYLAQHEQTRTQALKLQADLASIISENADALLPVVQNQITKRDLTQKDFAQAKVLVLALLDQARQEMAKLSIQPDLRWGPFYFVKEGKPVAHILHDSLSTSVASQLAKLVQNDTGQSLQISTLPKAPGDWANLRQSVILINTKGPQFDDICKQLNGWVTRRYPAEGVYTIHEDNHGNLWVVASDDDKLQMAVANLSRTSMLSPVWYVPDVSP